MLTARFVDRQFAGEDFFSCAGLNDHKPDKVKFAIQCKDGVVPFNEFKKLDRIENDVHLWRHKKLAVWMIENGKRFQLFISSERARETVYGRRAKKTLIRAKALVSRRGS